MAWLYVQEVSEWMMDLYANGADLTATLRECMEAGHHDAEIRVSSNCASKEFGLGDYLYELAFLAALIHHVKHGQLAPVFATERQQDIWQKWRDGELCKREYDDDEKRERAIVEELINIHLKVTSAGRDRYPNAIRYLAGVEL